MQPLTSLIRETALIFGDNLTDEEGGQCLEQIFQRLGSCQIFQTDNGREFGAACEKVIKQFALRYRKIHAKRKNENVYIESFRRSLRKECVGWIKYEMRDKMCLQSLIDQYLIHYHTRRPHSGLDLKIPAEVTKLHLR